MKGNLIAIALGLFMGSFYILGVMADPIYPAEKTIEPKVVLTVGEETAQNNPRLGFLTAEERDLVARMALAEAEGEEENGKRLVIDTILNRVDHESFPNSVKSVIFQQGQFPPTWNGRLNHCQSNDYILGLVLQEELIRTNNDVLFFNTGSYPKYGEPVLKVGNHYFTTLED